MFSNRISYSVVAVSVVFLAGCWNVLSTKPLGAPATDVELSELEGVWAWPDVTAFHVKHLSGNEFLVAWLQWKDGEFKKTEVKAVATKEEGVTYLNVVSPMDTDAEQYYILRLALFGKDTAVLYIPDPTAFATAVESGVVPGRVSRDSRGRVTKVYLSPTGDELERLVDPKLAGTQFNLNAPVVLRRIAGRK